MADAQECVLTQIHLQVDKLIDFDRKNMLTANFKIGITFLFKNRF